MQVVKGFAGFGGFVILVIGLAMLGVTIWAFTNASITFNNYTFLGILLAFDLLVIGASIVGIFGIKRQNGFMICVFQIFVMIFFFVFLGVGNGAEVLPRWRSKATALTQTMISFKLLLSHPTWALQSAQMSAHAVSKTPP